MKNLHLRMSLILVNIWIVSFFQCSTTHVTLQGFPLKSTLGGEQLNTIERLEENRIRAISLEKRLISDTTIQEKDGLLLQRCKTPDLTDWVSQRHLYTSIVTTPRRGMLSGRISGTSGNTIINVKD